jgi:hypothetical protein
MQQSPPSQRERVGMRYDFPHRVGLRQSVAEGRRPALNTIAAAMSRFHNRLSALEKKSSNY